MTVSDYLNGLTGEGLQWIIEFIDFMSEEYPEIKPKISFAMPMYVLGQKMNDKGYIAFSAAKEHFTLHVHPKKAGVLHSLIKALPESKFGKGCIKVNYSNPEYKATLKETVKNIIETENHGKNCRCQ